MQVLEGIGRLPDGVRKRALESANDKVLAALENRVLAFDRAAASAHAERMNAARRRGVNVGIADGMIGALAAMCEFAVARRSAVPGDGPARGQSLDRLESRRTS